MTKRARKEAELAVGEAEAGRHRLEELVLLRDARTPSAAATYIRPSSTCCSSLRSSLEQRRDLVGIGLVAGHILLGQVEHALDVLRPPSGEERNTCAKASSSSGETTPSALAILALSAMTAMVKAMSFCGSPPWPAEAERVGRARPAGFRLRRRQLSPSPRSSATPSWLQDYRLSLPARSDSADAVASADG